MGKTAWLLHPLCSLFKDVINAVLISFAALLVLVMTVDLCVSVILCSKLYRSGFVAAASSEWAVNFLDLATVQVRDCCSAAKCAFVGFDPHGSAIENCRYSQIKVAVIPYKTSIDVVGQVSK